MAEDERLEVLRNAVDDYIQLAGRALRELRKALKDGDADKQQECLELLITYLDLLKPEVST
jgi:hypothetical protein